MERRAPVSNTERARERMCGGVVGVGKSAFRVRRVRLAEDSNEAILSGEGGGLELSWIRIEERAPTDAAMV